jgi:hypothetical protein
MHLNLNCYLIKKYFTNFTSQRFTSIFLFCSQVEKNLISFFEKETLAKYLGLQFFYYTSSICVYLIYASSLIYLKYFKVDFCQFVKLFLSKNEQFIIINSISLATKNHLWFKYGLNISKTWKMSSFFSLLLFTVSSSRYAYLVNKKKYFQFKQGAIDQLTPLICKIFELYLYKLRNFHSRSFNKFNLLNNLSHFGKISRFFNFSLKHVESFTKIHAFTLLAVPYMMFYSFLLDQTYIWSGLINELQVYFQKGFI